MILLAIDPGPEKSAWVVWDGKEILAHGLEDNVEVRAVIAGYWSTADQIVVEMIGHYGTGMPAGKDVFETCIWIGRFLENAGRKGCWMKRPTIKTALCGKANAKDPNVRQALIDRLGKPGTKKQPGVTYGIHHDEWQALAVAVVWHDHAAKGAAQ